MVQQFYGPPLEPQVDLTAAEATYRQKVVDAYKWLNFSGFDSSDLSLANVPLEDVFVRLSLTVEKLIREPLPSVKSRQVERGENRQRERVITIQELVELGEALSNHLLIVGEPGAGKSTLLRWLAVTFAQGCQREPNRLGPSADADRLPVLVELGRLHDRYLQPEGGQSPNWIQYLPEYFTDQSAFTNTPPQLLTRALANGRCLLLFDGLDEVADRQVRARLARSLAELARLFPSNRVIIGSRPAGVSESGGTLHPQFQRSQIERFTPGDVQRFFRFWYALDHGLTSEQQSEAADALYARVQATPATLQLATTPLLSTILVLIWRNEGNLPERRVELYERCCHMLIERWEASHDVAYQGKLAGMDWKDHIHLLTPLAYAIHSQEQRTSATREELVLLLAQTLQTAGYSNEQAAATREAKQFLDVLSLRSGLLQYMGNDRYSFPHLTFQEYLAARYIAAQPDPNYIDLVMAHLHEAWWQQVHLLTLGVLSSRQASLSHVLSLLTTIIYQYPSPTEWTDFLLSGKDAPFRQVERYLTWLLGRNVKFCILACAECVDPTTVWKSPFGNDLLLHIEKLTRQIFSDKKRALAQRSLLILFIQTLLQYRSQFITPILLDMLCKSSSLTEMVAEYLGEIAATGNRVAIRLLLQAHQSSPQGVRRAIIKNLGQAAGSGHQHIMDALLQSMHDPQEDIQFAAIASLEKAAIAGNQPALQALLSSAQHLDAKVQLWAINSLGYVAAAGSQQAMDVLLQALHDLQKEIRHTAAVCLVQLTAKNNKQALYALLNALQDPNKKAQRAVIDSLAQITTSGRERALHALLQALQDSQSEQLLCTLLQAIEHADSFLYALVFEVLGPMAAAGNQLALRTLFRGIEHADSLIRNFAISSLGTVAAAGNQQALDALFLAQHDPDEHMQAVAVEGLGQVAVVGNQHALEVLFQALQHTHEEIRKAAIEALGQVAATGNQQAITALLNALQDPHHDVRRRAVSGLKTLAVAGNEQAVQALLLALHDSTGPVQKEAFFSLVQVGAAGNQLAITDLLNTLQDFDLARLEIAIPLEQVAAITNELLVQALIHSLSHSDYQGYKAAIRDCREIQITSPIQFRQVLRLLACHMHAPSEDIRGQAILSLDHLLDGRTLPLTQWEPLQQRRERRRHLKRRGYGFLLTALVLAISTIPAYEFGYLHGLSILLLGVLTFSLGAVAFVALRLGEPLSGRHGR